MHRLLARQLRRSFGTTEVPAEMRAFVDAVSAAYDEHDRDREQLERSMDLASEELLRRNEALREEQVRLHAVMSIAERIHVGVGEAELAEAGTTALREALPGLGAFVCDVQGTTARMVALALPEGFPQPAMRTRELANGKELFERVRAHEVVLLEGGAPSQWPVPMSIAVAGVDQDDDRLGTLCLVAKSPHTWTPRETETLHAVADFVGLALRDARSRARRRELEAHMVAAERMASVGTLAAGVAHEINNPLCYVIGNLSYLVESLPGELGGLGPEGADIVAALREARHGAERIRTIVRDLKTFSRADEDTMTDVDVRAVAESAIAMAQAEIKHRAHLVRDFADLPPVRANEARLGQVLLNLLVNAAHAIPEGAADKNTITVATRRAQDGRVIVEVRDTGCGIRDDIKSRIFDPFFTTKPIGVGTGLGLSICASIVGRLGGELTVESEVGRGSAFRVALPTQAPSLRHAATAAVAAEVPATRGRRILIVDDDVAVARSLARGLGAGHQITVETRAEAALARILSARERFDVIFCDLMMPEMTGMDLHDRLAVAAPDVADRMVFLTGGAFTPRARDFLEALPATRRLAKPFDLREVRRAVATAPVSP